MQHVAIYVRVSGKSQSTRSQLPDLKRWQSVHCEEGEQVKWYVDKQSGATMNRPAWSELWGDVQTRHVRRLVVWRIDRLGRTASGLTQLFDDLRAFHVDFVSLHDGILGLDAPAGRMMAGIIANVAQYELEVRSERQRAGIAAAQASGVRFGRPAGSKRPIRLTPDCVALIRKQRDDGATIASIARLLRLSRQSVYTALAGEPLGTE